MGENPRIEDLKRRVRSDPDSLAFAPLAEEYRRLGQFEEAISVCEAGLSRHPAYLSARVTLGRSLLEAGRLADSRRELSTVLESAPENLAATKALEEIARRERSTTPAQVDASATLAALERFLSSIRAVRASVAEPRH